MLVSFVTSRQRSTLATISCSSRIWERTRASVEKPVLPRRLRLRPSSSKRTSPSCWGEPIVNSRPASSQISACSVSAWPASCVGDRRELVRVELDALALHPGEHLDQRHLDLAHHPLEPEVGELRRWRAASSQAEARGLGRIVGLLVSPVRARAARRRAVRIASAQRDPLVGGELVELVGAARRVDQVGGDHRVVGEVERPGGEVGEQAARGMAADRLDVVGDQRMRRQRLRRSVARSGSSPPISRSPS